MTVPKISESEWEVMRVIWLHAPVTANDVVQQLSDKTWSPKTVKTLINRLVSKGALGFEQEGRTYHYHPLLAQADCARAERKSFVRRVYGGALAPMLANLLEEEQLTKKEVKELRRILDKKKGE